MSSICLIDGWRARLAQRLTTANSIKARLDRGKTCINHGLKFGVRENIRPIVLNAFADEFADVERIDSFRNAVLNHLKRFRRTNCVQSFFAWTFEAPGIFRSEVMIWVRTKPGHRTETPMPRGASSTRKPSERATTPYLLTLYGWEPEERSPAIEAVETMWPPSPCCSINGPKISMPQTTAIRLTPIVHSIRHQSTCRRVGRRPPRRCLRGYVSSHNARLRSGPLP